MSTSGNYQLEIVDIIEEAPLVKTFRLKPVGTELAYKAGQFLTFLTSINGLEVRRSYSLSSEPGVDKYPAITIKRIPNGYFSRRLFDEVRIGGMLTASGPATGIFTVPNEIGTYSAVWLFAAGIGITPIYPILRWLLHNSKLRVVLVYSNRSKEETVFYSAITAMAEAFKDRLTVVWLWSNHKDVLMARFSKESFPEIRKRYLTEAPASVLAYLCGPTNYMWLVQLLLQDTGLPKNAIRRELFETAKNIDKPLPPDQQPHTVTVLRATGRYTFTNTYPQSILSGAKAAGISLPYSCEAGQCGSCTAVCTAGKVWMSYNEVLTEQDLRDGRILTCTGHPIEGDITLEL